MESREECVTGRGLLRHRFWGDYSAVIAVDFGDAAAAQDALRALGAPWTVHSGHAAALLWVGDADALKTLKSVLATRICPDPCYSFGCRGALHPIDGLQHSVDYGSPFTLTVPIVPAEQLPLASPGR